MGVGGVVVIDPRLRDRVAVVTGTDSALGVGAAIARGLARQQVRLVVVRGPGAGDHVAEALRCDGATVCSVEADLAEDDSAQRIFDTAEHVFGGVEILINNAAHSGADSFARPVPRGAVEVDAASLDAHYVLNTRAPALLMREFFRRHVARGARWGRVISVSADAAWGAGGQVSLWASKNALESLTRSAAHEFGPAGITANIVAPGAVQTGWMGREQQRRLAEHSPLGRVGHPDDIADVVVFLASHQARWLTGQTLYAGGGARMV